MDDEQVQQDYYASITIRRILWWRMIVLNHGFVGMLELAAARWAPYWLRNLINL